MTLNKGEDDGISKRKHYISLCGELVLKRLCICPKTDYVLNE